MRALAAAAALLVSAAVPAASLAARQPPILRLVRASPLTVAGLHFQPREPVRLVVGGRVVRRVVASRTGSFVATLPGVVDRRTDLPVAARGTAGELVQLVSKLPKPACPMPETPPGAPPGS